MAVRLSTRTTAMPRTSSPPRRDDPVGRLHIRLRCNKSPVSPGKCEIPNTLAIIISPLDAGWRSPPFAVSSIRDDASRYPETPDGSSIKSRMTCWATVRHDLRCAGSVTDNAVGFRPPPSCVIRSASERSLYVRRRFRQQARLHHRKTVTSYFLTCG